MIPGTASAYFSPLSVLTFCIFQLVFKVFLEERFQKLVFRIVGKVYVICIDILFHFTLEINFLACPQRGTGDAALLIYQSALPALQCASPLL